jgi:hypothetical protein
MRAFRQTSAGVIIVVLAAAHVGSSRANPFSFFEPSVKVTPAERLRLDADDIVVRTLPADDGHVAVFAATRLDASPESLLQWTRHIEAFREGSQVVGVGRFSEPPADSDLRSLVLNDDELDALKKCKVGNCGLKLAASEIADVQQAVRAAGDDWRAAAQRTFRRILIARVRLHRTGGLLTLPPYADHGRRISVGEAFSAIVARSPYLTRALPDVVNSLLAPPHGSDDAGESFYYWTHDSYGSGKPIVTITYVRLLRLDDRGSAIPQALTLSTQLFASHYMEGALALTAVTCDATPAACYLVYLNRTQVDLLGGFFGTFKRRAIEGRIESATPDLLRDVRRRLERRVSDSEGGES